MLPILRTSWPTFVDEIFGNNIQGIFNDNFVKINNPSVNIAETKDNFRIEVAAPGLDKDDFKVNLEKNVLTISSEKEASNEQEEEGYLRKEFNYTSFCRRFTLPESVNGEEITATHKNGILYVTVPKREEAKVKPPRQIAVA
jgi:HSP20 family protein